MRRERMSPVREKVVMMMWMRKVRSSYLWKGHPARG